MSVKVFGELSFGSLQSRHHYYHDCRVGIGIIVWGIGNGGQPTASAQICGVTAAFSSNGWLGMIMRRCNGDVRLRRIEIIGITAVGKERPGEIHSARH